MCSCLWLGHPRFLFDYAVLSENVVGLIPKNYQWLTLSSFPFGHFGVYGIPHFWTHPHCIVASFGSTLSAEPNPQTNPIPLISKSIIYMYNTLSKYVVSCFIPSLIPWFLGLPTALKKGLPSDTSQGPKVPRLPERHCAWGRWCRRRVAPIRLPCPTQHLKAGSLKKHRHQHMIYLCVYIYIYVYLFIYACN